MFLSSLRRLFSRSAATSRARRPGRLWLECLEDRTLPSVVNWIGGSGNWNVASNWLDADTLTNHTPTAADEAVIDVAGVTVTHGSGTDTVLGIFSNEPLVISGGSLTLTGDSTLNSTLTMSNGTLAANGQVNLNVPFMWSGGALDGTGTGRVEANAGLVISGSGDKALIGSLTLDNFGSAIWTGTGFFHIQSNGAVFNNLAGATFDDRTDASIGSDSIFNPSGTFNNEGIFVKSAGTATGATYATQLTFNNSGTVEVMAGTLDLAGAGSRAPGRSISSGAFLTDPGATLDFGAGAQALTSTATVSGAGNVIFDSETFTNLHIVIGGAYHVSGLTTVRDTNAPFGNPDVTFTGSVEMGALNMGVGTLRSYGILTVDGALTWTGGTLGGRGQINANGGLIISGNNGVGLNGVTLNNAGAAIWSGTGSISANTGAVFNNLAGATFEIQGDAAFGGGGTRFNNAGAFLKSMGSGMTTINSIFDNTGTLEVASGRLNLANGGAGRGSFGVDSGTTLQFGGGTHTLSAPSSVTGDGTVVVSSGAVNVEGSSSFTGNLMVSGGTITFDVNVNLSALTLSGGTLSGVGDVAVSGLLTWTGGTMNGLGQTDANGGLNISGTNGKGLDSRTLNNSGAATWSDTGGISGSNAVFNNLAGASFEAQGDASFSGGGTRFNNAGAFLKSAGTGITSINVPFGNTGTLDVASGNVNLTNGSASQGSFTVEPGAKLQFAGNTHTLSATSSVNGGGDVVVTGGAVNVEGGATFTVNLTVSGGTITFDGNADLSTLTLSGGTLSGVGDVVVEGLLSWTGGTMSGQGQTDANGGLVISGNNNKGLDLRTLNNASAGVWSGTGNLSTSNDAIFNNLAGASFDVRGDATFGSGGTFNNAGAFSKSAGTGVTTIAGTFNNSGTLDVASGTVNLAGGGVGQGSFTVEAAKTLQFGGSTQTLTATASVSGGGNVVVSSGNVNVEGSSSFTSNLTVSGGTINFDMNVDLSTLTLSGGALSGVGDVAVDGLLAWTGGTMSGQGQTDANGSLVMSNGTSNKILDSRTLNNAGAATWSGLGNILGSNGAVFNNLAGATFEVQGDAAFGDSSCVFNNAGAFFKSMGSGVTNINAFVYNTGSIEVDSGALTVNNDFVNAGFLSPGGNGHTAVLTINGSYFQTASGVLSIDLGGATAGAQYDQLHVTGTLLLDGTLQVQLVNGFSPALGDSFQVLTFNPGSVIGDFATMSLPTLDGGLSWAPTYTSTALTLLAVAG